MLAIGFLTGLLTACRRVSAAGFPVHWLADIFLLTLCSAVAGSRIWYAVENWQEKFQHAPWEVFYLARGGLVYYGGFFGATAAVLLYARWRDVSFWRLADVIAPSVALGYACTRVGCFMNGCCYGSATSLPWAIVFPPGHPTLGALVHPAQLYSVLLNLGLYIGLEMLFIRRRFDGEIIGNYFSIYGCLRFLAEFFRGDSRHSFMGMFTTAQGVSVALILVGLAINIAKNPDRRLNTHATATQNKHIQRNGHPV
jgi:phosphatidylglycerol:prolipoprotein diacylglycerol transferase